MRTHISTHSTHTQCTLAYTSGWTCLESNIHIYIPIPKINLQPHIYICTHIYLTLYTTPPKFNSFIILEATMIFIFLHIHAQIKVMKYIPGLIKI